MRAVILLFSSLCFALVLSKGKTAAENPSVTSLQQECATSYRDAAAAYVKEGWLSGAVKAWKGILEILPGDQAAERELLVIQKAMAHHAPGRTPPLPPRPPKRKALFNGKTLKGLKVVEGDFFVEEGVLRTLQGEGGLILSTTRITHEAFEITCSLQGRGSSYGLVFTSQKGGRIALLFQKNALSLFSLKKKKPVLALKTKTGRGWKELRIEVFQKRAFFYLGGELLGKWDFESAPKGPVGLFSEGPASLQRLDVAESATPALCAHAARLIERDFLQGALEVLEKIKEKSPGYPETHYHIGIVMDRLFEKEKALEAYKEFLSASEGLKGFSMRVSRFLKNVPKRIEELEAYEKDIGEIRNAYVEGLRVMGKEAYLSRDGERAVQAFGELERIKSLDRRSGKYKTLLQFEGTSKDGWRPIFNGTDLSGWEVAGGKWTVEDTEGVEGKVLKARSDFEQQARLFPLSGPFYPRFLFECSFYAKSMVNFGFLIGKKKGGFCLHLKNVFRDKFIQLIMDDGSGEVKLFKRFSGKPPKSKEWHTFALLCDYNRIFIMLNGTPQASRTFAQDILSPPGLYVEKMNEMDFRNVRLRLLGNEKEYQRVLSKFNGAAEAVVECERVLPPFEARGGNPKSFSCQAYNGGMLGNWGRKGNQSVSTPLELPALASAYLHLRYSLVAGNRNVQVSLDEGTPRPLSLEPTGERETFAFASLPLDAVQGGFHTVKISSGEGGKPVNLDRFIVSASPDPPRETHRIIASEKAPHFVIRTSPRVEIAIESNRIFPLVEAVHDYLTAYFGYAPDEKLTFQVISRECWIDRHAGGYAVGHSLFIPEEDVYGDIHLVIHEMSHCFDFGVGYNPPWFGEGKSYPIFLDFVKENRDAYRENISPKTMARARNGRTSIKSLADPKGNLLQFWGTEKFPYGNSTKRMAGYLSAAFVSTRLREICGKDWLKNYFALIRKDMERGAFFMPTSDTVLANNVIIDYLSRGNGMDLRPHFKEWGFNITDIYREGEGFQAECGKEEDPFLTDRGSCRSGSWEREEKAIFLEEGSLCYTFPVRKERGSVKVELCAEGLFQVLANGKTLLDSIQEKKKEKKSQRNKRGKKEDSPFRGKIYSLTLEEAQEWADCRLTLLFEVLEERKKGKKKKGEEEAGQKGFGLAWIKILPAKGG